MQQVVISFSCCEQINESHNAVIALFTPDTNQSHVV